ncbi:hypothetical protein B0H10DRAFT_2092552, partial [Mycena sp. CBHHK59/15]
MATFTWEVSAELHITPGQAVIMDIAPLVGVPAYRHMAPSKPTRASARGGCPACTALRDRRARTRSRCARSPAARSRARCSPSSASSRTCVPRHARMRAGWSCVSASSASRATLS